MAQVEDDDMQSFNLYVRIDCPKYERPIYDGSEVRLSSDVWPSRCVLHAYIGGEHLGWCRLPEGRDHPRRVEGWSVSFVLPLQREYWGRLSLDLEVERRDAYYDEDDGVVRLFHREDPHTSSRTAVIGRARVALVDALLRDGDEDEDEDSVRMLREKAGLPALVKGTREYNESVRLHGLRFPAREPPTKVVSGKLAVCMSLEARRRRNVFVV
uniref:Uncharacterized protein n=1 Tax=Oryza punctata TaxID=4537 RepID=A0A0E0KBG3_ORYPU